MNPQAQTVTPQPTTTSPQGVASVAPIQAPSQPVLPQAPSPVATPAPVQAPDFHTSQQLQNIASYYNIPRQTQAIAGAGQAEGNVAQTNFEAQKAQNEIKIQNQKDSLDPTKYTFVKNKDGSVSILNSVGDSVNIGQYAALTGSNPAQALQNAGATDENDQKFISAYNNLQSFVQTKIAAQNGDTQAVAQLADYYKNNPGLNGLQLGQLQGMFMKSYGGYFGQPQHGGGLENSATVTPTLTSANNPLTTSPYENMNYFGSQENSNPYAMEAGFGNAAGTYGANSVGSSLSSALGGIGNNNNGL